MAQYPLTLKQEKFVEVYLKIGNASEAYRQAYPTSKKWSDNVLNVKASQMLAADKIKIRINGHKRRNDITVDRVLREETCLAYSDVRQLFEGFTLTRPDELPEDVARAIAGIEVKERIIPSNNGDEPVREITYKYKLWDKGKSLERISKHLGLFEADNKQKNEMQAKLLSEVFAGVPQLIQLLQDRLTAPNVGQLPPPASTTEKGAVTT